MIRTSPTFLVLLTLVLIAIDQFSKYAAVSFGLPIFMNDQFAFSLAIPKVVMYIFYTVIELGILYYIVTAYEKLNNREKIAWMFIIAGSVSNIGERIILGAVRDFIPLFNGILNIADFYILGGVAILLFGNFYLRKN